MTLTQIVSNFPISILSIRWFFKDRRIYKFWIFEESRTKFSEIKFRIALSAINKEIVILYYEYTYIYILSRHRERLYSVVNLNVVDELDL